MFQALKNTEAWINDTMGPIFSRLSVMPLFSDREGSVSRPEGVQSSMSLQPTSLREAESLLEVLVIRSGRLFRCGDAYRHGALRGVPVSAGLLASQQEIRDLIERVRLLFARFDEQTTQDGLKGSWYFSFVIRTEICRIRTLKAFDPDEVFYDNFGDTFRALTQIAQHPGCAVRMLADSALETEFRSEIGYPQLVYFITTKCRHLATRLTALKLLRKYSKSLERDSYDLHKLYMYSRRIIEVEHDLILNRSDQPVGPVAWTELPSEEARVLSTFTDPYDVIRARIKGQSVFGRPEGFIMHSAHGGLCLRLEFMTVKLVGDPILGCPSLD